MKETSKYPRKRDEKKIDIRESWDINFWCEELSLRAEELKEIVNKVGPSVDDVRLHLAKQRLIFPPVTY